MAQVVLARGMCECCPRAANEQITTPQGQAIEVCCELCFNSGGRDHTIECDMRSTSDGSYTPPGHASDDDEDGGGASDSSLPRPARHTGGARRAGGNQKTRGHGRDDGDAGEDEKMNISDTESNRLQATTIWDGEFMEAVRRFRQFTVQAPRKMQSALQPKRGSTISMTGGAPPNEHEDGREPMGDDGDEEKSTPEPSDEEVEIGSAARSETDATESEFTAAEFVKPMGKLKIPTKTVGESKSIDPKKLPEGKPSDWESNERHHMCHNSARQTGVEDPEDESQWEERERTLHYMNKPHLIKPVEEELMWNFAALTYPRQIHELASCLFHKLGMPEGGMAMGYDLDLLLPWNDMLRSCHVAVREIVPEGSMTVAVKMAIMLMQADGRATDRWVMKRQFERSGERSIVYWREEAVLEALNEGMVAIPKAAGIHPSSIMPGTRTGVPPGKVHVVVNEIQRRGKSACAASTQVIIRGWKTVTAARIALQDKKASSKGGYDNRVTMRDFDLVVAELVVKGKLQIRNGIRWDDKKKSLKFRRTATPIGDALPEEWQAKLKQLGANGRIHMGNPHKGSTRIDEWWNTVRHGKPQATCRVKGHVAMLGEHVSGSHQFQHIQTMSKENGWTLTAQMSAKDKGTTCFDSNTVEMKREEMHHNGRPRPPSRHNSNTCGCKVNTGLPSRNFITCGNTVPGKTESSEGKHKAVHCGKGKSMKGKDKENKLMIPLLTAMHAAYSFLERRNLPDNYFFNKVLVDYAAGSQTGYAIAVALGMRYEPRDIRQWVKEHEDVHYNLPLDLLPGMRLEYAHPGTISKSSEVSNLGMNLMGITCHAQTSNDRGKKRKLEDGMPLTQYAVAYYVQLHNALMIFEESAQEAREHAGISIEDMLDDEEGNGADSSEDDEPDESVSGNSGDEEETFTVGSTRVLKQFGDGKWYGGVISARSGKKLKVKYDDGDVEVVSRSQATALMQAAVEHDATRQASESESDVGNQPAVIVGASVRSEYAGPRGKRYRNGTITAKDGNTVVVTWNKSDDESLTVQQVMPMLRAAGQPTMQQRINTALLTKQDAGRHPDGLPIVYTELGRKGVLEADDQGAATRRPHSDQPVRRLRAKEWGVELEIQTEDGTFEPRLAIHRVAPMELAAYAQKDYAKGELITVMDGIEIHPAQGAHGNFWKLAKIKIKSESNCTYEPRNKGPEAFLIDGQNGSGWQTIQGARTAYEKKQINARYAANAKRTEVAVRATVAVNKGEMLRVDYRWSKADWKKALISAGERASGWSELDRRFAGAEIHAPEEIIINPVDMDERGDDVRENILRLFTVLRMGSDRIMRIGIPYEGRVAMCTDSKAACNNITYAVRALKSFAEDEIIFEEHVSCAEDDDTKPGPRFISRRLWCKGFAILEGPDSASMAGLLRSVARIAGGSTGNATMEFAHGLRHGPSVKAVVRAKFPISAGEEVVLQQIFGEDYEDEGELRSLRSRCFEKHFQALKKLAHEAQDATKFSTIFEGVGGRSKLLEGGTACACSPWRKGSTDTGVCYLCDEKPQLEGTGYDILDAGESYFVSGPVREHFGKAVKVNDVLVNAPSEQDPDVFDILKKHFQREGWLDRADGVPAVGEGP